MNQTEQMRETLQAIANMPEHDQDDAHRLRYMAQQALAHVNETPKNEHDSEDVLKPAKLVRLNDDALVNIYLGCKAEWKATNKRKRERIAVIFGNAIMDAMEKLNGGR